MFRPLRRKKRAITDEEARELLATCKRGVFAVNGDDGYPYAIPVNYFFDAEHDKIYFHGAKAGHKVDSLRRDDKVCFTVYGNEWYKDGDWAPYVMSTVVFGRCRLVDEAPAFIEDKVRQLALKYYPSAEDDFGHGFSEGMKISHSGNESVEQAINLRIATLMPEDFSSFKDSVYNERTQSYVPVAYTQLITNVKVDRM